VSRLVSSSHVSSVQLNVKSGQYRSGQARTMSGHYRSDHVWLGEVMTWTGMVMSC